MEGKGRRRGRMWCPYGNFKRKSEAGISFSSVSNRVQQRRADSRLVDERAQGNIVRIRKIYEACQIGRLVFPLITLFCLVQSHLISIPPTPLSTVPTPPPPFNLNGSIPVLPVFSLQIPRYISFKPFNSPSNPAISPAKLNRLACCAFRVGRIDEGESWEGDERTEESCSIVDL